MTNQEIIRAWKDESYLISLSESARALLPDNPVGLVELSESDLRGESVDLNAAGVDEAQSHVTVSIFTDELACTWTVTLPICRPPI
jgi:mersacidin/lichenicidin family type 2 lantibiotic